MIEALLLGSVLASDPFTLEWTAPAGCPSEDDARGRIAAALGEVDAPTLRAQASITQTEDGMFALALTLGRDGEPPGTRTLEGASCAEVADAAVLVIAIAIDPNAAAALLEPEPTVPEPPPVPPEPDPEPKPEPDPEPDPTPPPEPTPPREPATHSTPGRAAPPSDPSLDLGVDTLVQGGAALGVLPSASGMVGVHVALHGSRWRAEVGGTYETPTNTTAPGNSDVGGRFQLWSVDVRGCPVLGRAAVAVPLCLGFRAGQMHGAGRGSLERADAASPWLGVSFAPTLLWRPPTVAGGRLILGARGELSVSLTAPGFATTQGNAVFEGGPLGGQFSALVGFSLR